MDTPKTAISSLRESERGCDDIIMKEDSGYVTVTPSSAELTGIDNSLLSRSTQFHLPEKSSNTSDARANNDNDISGAYLLSKTYIDSESLDPADRSDQNTLTRVLVHNEPVDSTKFEIKGKSRLRRQNAVSIIHEVVGTDASPGQGINSRFKDMTINSIHKSENLHCDDMSMNSTPLLPTCGKLKRSRLRRASTQPCPFTPVKNKRRRFSPEEYSQSVESPSSEEEFSPIFNFSTYHERRHAKKLNFTPFQKIGEPEKNQLLYPEIKPVTPPKKIRTPEKLRKQASSANDLKCRRCLPMSKKKYCDFFKMLGEEQLHTPAIEIILSKLSDDDLENVCKVSKCWRSVCLNDPVAKIRRKNYLQMKTREKENAIAQNSKKLSGPSSSFGSKCLMEMQNSMNLMPPHRKIISRSPSVSPGKRKSYKFWKAASEDTKRKLKKCPRCDCPAQITGKYATCRGINCGFSFCINCLTNKTDKSNCCQNQIESSSPSKQVASKTCVGSKSSRKNLRRL